MWPRSIVHSIGSLLEKQKDGSRVSLELSTTTTRHDTNRLYLYRSCCDRNKAGSAQHSTALQRSTRPQQHNNTTPHVLHRMTTSRCSLTYLLYLGPHLRVRFQRVFLPAFTDRDSIRAKSPSPNVTGSERSETVQQYTSTIQFRLVRDAFPWPVITHSSASLPPHHTTSYHQRQPLSGSPAQNDKRQTPTCPWFISVLESVAARSAAW